MLLISRKSKFEEDDDILAEPMGSPSKTSGSIKRKLVSPAMDNATKRERATEDIAGVCVCACVRMHMCVRVRVHVLVYTCM